MKINITAGVRIREVSSQVVTEKVKGASPQPDPEYLDDLGSGTRNDQLTPGNIAQVRGSRLKFDAGDPAQGVFLVAANGTETKVVSVSRNKPAQLDFLIPALNPGEYSLEIRVSLNGKDLKKGILPATLLVS